MHSFRPVSAHLNRPKTADCGCSAGRLASAFVIVFVALLAGCATTFDVQGHRGARGLAPENTLAAFDAALSVGVTTLELDLAISADKVAVISHEQALYEPLTRNAQGHWLPARGPLIKNLSVAQLQAFDVGRLNPDAPYAKPFAGQQAADGERLPTLRALFDRVRALGIQDVRFNIETKIFPDRPNETVGPDEFVDIVLATIREAGMTHRVSLQSFDWRTLQRVQQLAPGIPTVYLTFENQRFSNLVDGSWSAGFKKADFSSVPQMVKAAGGRVWSPNFNNLQKQDLAIAQNLGLQVIPWTVNNPDDMDRLLQWGVDGLITDFPDRLRERMQLKGMALPKAYAAEVRALPRAPQAAPTAKP
jgi:glycerophosphoryl diester phosphodiesterase